MAGAPGRVLVIGASGFLGSEVCAKLVLRGQPVVALARRVPQAQPNGGKDITWVSCDATDTASLRAAVRDHGPFKSVVHCMGALFDGQTRLRRLNVVVSAAGSTCAEGVTYEHVTRDTSLAVLAEMEAQGAAEGGSRGAFLFVSAAEAGLPETVGVRAAGFLDKWLLPDWLRRYLAAKREVEQKCAEAKVRTVIFRPGFIWRWNKFDILAPALLTKTLNALRFPGVDKPVHVETVGAAIAEAALDENVSGVQRYWHMEELAAASLKKQE